MSQNCIVSVKFLINSVKSLGSFKCLAKLIEKINSNETNFCQCFKRKSYPRIIKCTTNYFSSSTTNNFLIANLLHFCRNHERL
jgi:hypothetical protein